MRSEIDISIRRAIEKEFGREARLKGIYFDV